MRNVFVSDEAFSPRVHLVRKIEKIREKYAGVPIPILTKSLVMNGVQCRKRVWYEVNRASDVPQPTDNDRERMQQGQQVTTWARRLYPQGRLIPAGDRESVVQATQAALRDRVPLFEAGFFDGETYVRVDVLLPSGDGWDLVEVKSGAHVKEYYYTDVAVQRDVLARCGITVGKCFVIVVNSEYVRQGAIEPEKLFFMHDVTEQVDTIAARGLIEGVRAAVVGSEPIVRIGMHCTNPHACPLKEKCWSYLPSHNVTELYWAGAKKFAHLDNEILEIACIPADVELTTKQLIQKKAIEENRVQIDAARLAKHLAPITYPIAYLDFETTQPAIPAYEGTSPFENIPFQFSLHIEHEDGSIDHVEYLHAGKDDPRPALLHTLHRALPASGTIIAHNAGFEIKCLLNCMRAHPEHTEWITHAVKRFWDLIKPFQDFAYYHPDQHGSCSIKAILPAAVGKTYKDLTVGDGGTAAREWMRVTFEDVLPAEREAMRAHLLTYCKLDTQAMVDVVHVLRKHV